MAVGRQRLPATPTRRVLTFALGADGMLPPWDLPPGREKPPAVDADDDVVAGGARAYTRFCARCHGASAVSDGSVPDLRKLPGVWYERFDEVVLNGLLVDAGMPRFDSVLSATDSAAIKAYVLHRAEEQWQLDQDGRWWQDIKLWVADKVAALLLLFA